MSRSPGKKALYRIRNWAQYDQALVRRGSLTVWIDGDALDAWHDDRPRQRGAQYVYSDTAIVCLL